jgi:hypothetical protein
VSLVLSRCLGWFQSFLSGRTQSVKALGVTSPPTPLYFDVPQGSVLGPSLFSVYTIPAPVIASRHGKSIKQFSDDTQESISTWIPTVSLLLSAHLLTVLLTLRIGLTTIAWRWTWEKSLLLYIVPQRHSSELVTPSLVVGDATLPPSVQARNFGVIFDSALFYGSSSQ